MMADVADALEHAHDEGVIHRDIKPSNLLLSPDGRLSVNDFGLARMLEQPGMTISGEFVGSPLYMSPEQITAGRVPLDHRTDIYSLGATLYELLTLRPPFPAKQRDQVLSQIIHKEPEPLRKSNDKVPRDLETICLKSLDKDPDRRYQTAGQMAADLRRYINRHAISARRIGPVEKTIRYLRRNPYAAAFLGLLLVTVSIASIAGWQAYEGRRHQELRLIENDLFQAVLRGDYNGADELLRNGERLRPPSAWVEFARGQISLYRGEYEAAKTSFGRVLDEEPNNIAAKSLLSVAYMWGGDEISYSEQIAEINEVRNEFDDLLFLGYAKTWAHPEESIKLLNRADQIDRNHPLVRVFRASAGRIRAMELVDSTEAKRLIDKAIEDCESSKGLLEDTPLVFSEYTRANLAAANIYRKLAKSASSDTQFHLDQVARFLDAAKSTRAELERFRNDSRAQFTLVSLLQQTFDDDAIRELAAQWDREGVKVHTYAAQFLGLELFRMREYEKALRWLNRATGRQERNTRYLKSYVKLAIPRGESRGKIRQQASAYLEDKLNENERSFLSSDVMLLVLLGDEQAIQYYSQDALRALIRAGEVYAPLNEYFCPLSERLIKTPEQLIAKCSNTTIPVPARMHAHFDLGVEALSRRDFDAAAVYFEKCWQDDNFHFYVYGLSRAILEHKEDWPTWVPVDKATEVQE